MPLVARTLAGGSSTVIAYGQTGSGKTHTTQQLHARLAAALLARCHDAGQSLELSAFENMGDKCFDLLNDRAELALREDGEGQMQVCGLTATAIESQAAFEAAVAWGAEQRAHAATATNALSSRSHAVWTFRLLGDDDARRGRLRVVDLAGSERRKDSEAHSAERIEEMKQINYSLGCLKECVRLNLARATAGEQPGRAVQHIHIPYRNCKLTMLLKECFEPGEGGGRAASVFISHLSPLHSSVGHTLNTLDYTVAMIEATRAEQERAKFQGPETWSRKKTQHWVSTVEGGKYAGVAAAFSSYTGKALSIEWRGDVVKKVEALGGTEDDAMFLLDTFYELCQAAKKALAAEKRKAAAAAKSGGGGGGGDDGAADGEDAEEWRARFLAYYKTNAPDKVKMINDGFMQKWAGRYEELFGKLVAKYGQPPGGGSGGGGSGGGGALGAKMARDRAILSDAKAKQDGASVYNPAGKELDVLGYEPPADAGGRDGSCGSYAGGTLGCGDANTNNK